MKLKKTLILATAALMASTTMVGFTSCDLLSDIIGGNSSTGDNSSSNKPEATLVDVKLMFNADRLTYLEGETFDPTGISLMGEYSDGTRKQITDFEIDNTDPLTMEDTVITITYLTYTFPQNITVQDPSEAIILTFDQGIDVCYCYGDGTVLQGNSEQLNGEWGWMLGKHGTWSWDGENFELIIEGVEYEVVADAQGAMKFDYVFVDWYGDEWPLTLSCPKAEWDAALEGRTYPVVSEGNGETAGGEDAQ